MDRSTPTKPTAIPKFRFSGLARSTNFRTLECPVVSPEEGAWRAVKAVRRERREVVCEGDWEGGAILVVVLLLVAVLVLGSIMLSV